MANIKNQFDEFLKNNYLNLNYKKIYKKFKKIIKNSNNKDSELKDYVYSLVKKIVKQNIDLKTHVPTAHELSLRERVLPSATHVSMMSIGFFHRMCEEIDDSHKIKENFGLQDNEIIGIIHGEVNKTVKYNSILEFMESDPFDLLLSEVDSVVNVIEENTTYSQLKKMEDKNRLQEIYMKKEMAKQRMATHGKIWRFIYSSLVKDYNEFIAKSESLLDYYKFDQTAIMDAIQNFSNVDDRFDDIGLCNEFFEQKQEQIEDAKKFNGKVGSKTINEIRYNKARNEEEKTHALENKMNEITSKYQDMDSSCSSIGMLKEKCINYDKTQDINLFKEATRQIFWAFYTNIVARQGIENLNIKEAMHDSNKLTLLVMNRYTPIYEDPRLAEILPDLSFGTMNGEVIERATKKGLNVQEINVKEEAQMVIDEYKQADNVKQDKQFLGIEKTNILIIDDENVEEINIVDEIDQNDKVILGRTK